MKRFLTIVVCTAGLAGLGFVAATSSASSKAESCCADCDLCPICCPDCCADCCQGGACCE